MAPTLGLGKYLESHDVRAVFIAERGAPLAGGQPARMTARTRIALLFADGNFIGREYFAAFRSKGIRPDLTLAVGSMGPRSVAIEQVRTGGLWNPPEMPAGAIDAKFDSLTAPDLWQLLAEASIDIAVQGGIGILTPEMIAVPKIGFLNVHPGRLPHYRGRNCPEWALQNGDPIWTTAHLIDSGVDTGPVVCERRYDFPDDWSYERIRANLYGHCAGTLVEALDILGQALRDGRDLPLRPQPEAGARSWPKMDDSMIADLRARLGTAHAR